MTKPVRSTIDEHINNALMPKTRLERLSSDFKYRLYEIQEKPDDVSRPLKRHKDISLWSKILTEFHDSVGNPLKYEKSHPLLQDVMFYSVKKGNEIYKYLKTRLDFYTDKEPVASVKPKRNELEPAKPLTTDEIALIRRMDKLSLEKEERIYKFDSDWMQLLITKKPEDYKEKLILFELYVMEKYNLTYNQLKRISVHAIFIDEHITNYDLFMGEIENVSLT